MVFFSAFTRSYSTIDWILGLPSSESPRVRRQANLNESGFDATEGAPVPMDEDDTSTQALILQLENEDKINQLKKKPEIDPDEGVFPPPPKALKTMNGFRLSHPFGW